MRNGSVKLQTKKIRENTMKIYVGNLSRSVVEDDLKEAFETFGKIESVSVVKNKNDGESRGFGFVEMPSKEEAEAAINGLNGTDLKGQNLNVNEARPRPEKRRDGGR